jgi:hypothetical protein
MTESQYISSTRTDVLFVKLTSLSFSIAWVSFVVTVPLTCWLLLRITWLFFCDDAAFCVFEDENFCEEGVVWRTCRHTFSYFANGALLLSGNTHSFMMMFGKTLFREPGESERKIHFHQLDSLYTFGKL